jgi:hypothetical protein
MKSFFAALLCLIVGTTTYGQKTIDKVKFFKDSSVINATLTLNLKKILAGRDKIGELYPATFSCKMEDGLDVNDHITVELRGHSRRAYCTLLPLKLIYKNDPTDAFYKLKSVKLVSSCMATPYDEQNLLKEFLVYKIYNLLTDKSFRVRLLNMSYRDSIGKKKTVTEHAFMLEDIKEVAKRNDCSDWTARRIGVSDIDRFQMNEVAVFEYMIGNTDWGVTSDHNIRVIHSKSDSLSRPFAVPYDFDSSGFVNTNYSSPDAKLELESVRERLYMGPLATKEELEAVFDVFNKKKAAIYAMINNFNLLTPDTKKDVTGFLDRFYKTIDNPSKIKSTFINPVK